MTEELEKKEEQIRIIAKVLEEKDAAYKAQLEIQANEHESQERQATQRIADLERKLEEKQQKVKIEE